jgi:uncharacterized phage infection (PIP) family protein YhgE
MGIADRIEKLARQAGEKLGDAVEGVKKEAAEGGRIDQALDAMGHKIDEVKKTEAFAQVADAVGDLKDAATTKIDEVKKTEGYAQMADRVADLKDAAATKIDETLDRVDVDPAPADPAAAQPEAPDGTSV